MGILYRILQEFGTISSRNSDSKSYWICSVCHCIYVCIISIQYTCMYIWCIRYTSNELFFCLVLGIVVKPLQHQQLKSKSKSSIPHAKVTQKLPTSYLNKTKPLINNARVFITPRPKVVTKQWSKTNSTSGIVNPFKIDKIEPLRPEVSKNVTTKTGKGNIILLIWNNLELCIGLPYKKLSITIFIVKNKFYD